MNTDTSSQTYQTAIYFEAPALMLRLHIAIIDIHALANSQSQFVFFSEGSCFCCAHLLTVDWSVFISQPLLAQDDPFIYLDFSYSAANASNLESNVYGLIKGSMSLHENIYMGTDLEGAKVGIGLRVSF